MYLHNRPKAVILHCLDRKARSSRFEPEDITTTTSEGVFEVKSEDNIYTIDFKSPSCSCPDWIQTNYPCKHFFAVFRNHPTWDWNALPSTYLESPRLSLDKQALDDYFNSGHPTPNSSITTDLSLEDENEDVLSMEDYTGTIPKKKTTAKDQKEEAMKARITLKAIESLTYTCTDPQLLKKLNKQLQDIMNEFRSSLPESEGLVILPAVHERVKQAIRSSKSQKLSSLPLYKKRGRKRLDSAYRNRVGRRADALRKAARKYLLKKANNTSNSTKKPDETSTQNTPPNQQSMTSTAQQSNSQAQQPVPQHLSISPQLATSLNTSITPTLQLNSSAKEVTTETTHCKTNPLQQRRTTGRKRARCGSCTGCVAEDCQVCAMCLDKPKYGGPGKKKQCCIKRRCLNLTCELAPTVSESVSKPDIETLISTLHTQGIKLGVSSTTHQVKSTMSKDEMLKAINQPNSKYVKLPGATFPDELPLNKQDPKRLKSFTEANNFLESHDRQLHPIRGDGNCLFRALSHLLFGREDHHDQIRHTLTDFIATNKDIFSKYCTQRTIEEHIARMKYETIWGTDLEIRAAASYLELPIYVCTQRSRTLEYYWDCFKPLTSLIPPQEHYISDIPQTKALHHLEICHRDRCHYDVVNMLNGWRPLYPPPLDNTTAYMNLTENI